MPTRNILVPICPDVAAERQLEAALKIARRVEGHVNAVFIRPDAEAVFASLPEVARRAGVTTAAIEQEFQEAEARARAGFDAWRGDNKLACEPVDGFLRDTYGCFGTHVGPLEVAMLQQGRLSDLIVLNFPGAYHSATERAFDTAVFDSGRPVLLVPNTVPDDLLRHVLIAWNGSLELARAVAGALPLLHAAERVAVFTAPWRNDDFLDPGDGMRQLDLPGYLVWHGIRARSFRAGPEHKSVGAALLHAAAEHHATMLVMGAYTRSRVRGILLGGVTSHVLQNAGIPILMAH